jgi:hypothetical protein
MVTSPLPSQSPAQLDTWVGDGDAVGDAGGGGVTVGVAEAVEVAELV